MSKQNGVVDNISKSSIEIFEYYTANQYGEFTDQICLLIENIEKNPTFEFMTRVNVAISGFPKRLFTATLTSLMHIKLKKVVGTSKVKQY